MAPVCCWHYIGVQLCWCHINTDFDGVTPTSCFRTTFEQPLHRFSVVVPWNGINENNSSIEVFMLGRLLCREGEQMTL